MSERCDNCFFSRPIDNPDAVACRRFPPQVLNMVGNRVNSADPLVSNDWWCGEWRTKDKTSWIGWDRVKDKARPETIRATPKTAKKRKIA